MKNKNYSQDHIQRFESSWFLGKNAQDSLILNDFDSTWIPPKFSIDNMDQHPTVKDFIDKNNYKNVDGYHILDSVLVENYVQDKSWKVEYKHNGDWFRCDHFKKDHDGLHILFAGCSCTEGIGENIEYNWSHLLYSKLAENYKTSGYFNIGRAGYGWHKIITNTLVYIEKFGIPDIVFILHPNILRNFEWDDEWLRWKYNQKLPLLSTKSKFAKIDKTEQPYLDEYLQSFPNWSISWMLFIKYLEQLGINVVWSTWDFTDSQNIMNFYPLNKNFVNLNISKELLTNEITKVNFKKEEIAARDGHPGRIENRIWSQRFYDKIMSDNEMDKYENYKKNNL
jgi:hypothetical protein